ncbi:MULTISPECIES: hypothetical protein [unclassified Micromonospora]|uniref:hypothetical protein n=1 Tax=unclassified Micromonospora TaxID=2617518 RepID=UPI002FF42CB6
MTLLRAIDGELRKTLALPAALVALGVALFGTIAAVSLIVASSSAQPGHTAHATPAGVVFDAVPLGTVGAVILGVIVISSEYTANSPDVGGGRQIGATLVAIPHRLILLLSKVAVVVVLIVATTAVAVAASLALAHVVLGTTEGQDDPGDTIARAAGVALYWTLMSLIAMAVTVFTRTGIVPLIWFIANSSLISVSLLLSKATSLARYLPDLAGMRLFAAPSSLAVHDPLEPFAGGLVMAAWAIVLLAASTLVFTRRDA